MDYIQHFEVELSTLAILYNTNSVNMSLKAVCEVLVYFESFKNWDLYDQGIYFIKARLEQDLKDKQVPIFLMSERNSRPVSHDRSQKIAPVP